MITINEVISGDTAASVSLLTLLRSDNAQTPAGVTLPLAFTDEGGDVWNCAFADPSPAPVYTYTFRITWGDGSTNDGSGTISAAAPAGDYGFQAGMERIYGVNNIRIWSNKENDDANVDPVAIQGAIDDAELYFNRRLRESDYTAPIPSTSKDFDYIAWLVNEYAGVLLYLGRGEWAQEEGKNLAGKMEKRRTHALGEMDRILDAGLDATRPVAQDGGISVVSPDPSKPGVPSGTFYAFPGIFP